MEVHAEKIKVLIVDDSATIRRILEDIVNGAPDMTVIGSAADAYEAREIMRRVVPDVVTLDIEMPRMDGLTFLDKLMRAMPIPVVMISALTQESALATFKALELGAIDYIAKPAPGFFLNLEDLAEEILEKIRAAATVPRSFLERHRFREKMSPATRHTLETEEFFIVRNTPRFTKPNPLIAIGASAGGTTVIESLLRYLDPHLMPPIVITQHIPPHFSRSFAERLNAVASFSVSEGRHGQMLKPGEVIVAPGGQHLIVERSPSGYVAVLNDGPRVNRHRPSIDVLFSSVAAAAKDSAIGIILTGMGSDGAKGLLDIRTSGGYTIAQSREGCAVYSMPRAAVELGAVVHQLSVEGIAGYLNRMFGGGTP